MSRERTNILFCRVQGHEVKVKVRDVCAGYTVMKFIVAVASDCPHHQEELLNLDKIQTHICTFNKAPCV